MVNLLSSAEAAEALQVGVSSIKRWTDDALLAAIRTPGGHRRYTPSELARFAHERGITHSLSAPDRLASVSPRKSSTRPTVEALRRGDLSFLEPRSSDPATRAAHLDAVGDVLRRMGVLWEKGRLSVDEEHSASHRLVAALERLRPEPADGPLALLACPPGERHDLPLHLVRLVLEWRGWRTDLAGADLPWPAMLHAVERTRPALLALSARAADLLPPLELQRLSRLTTVIAGGSWARGPAKDVLRFRTLRGFNRWLGSL